MEPHDPFAPADLATRHKPLSSLVQSAREQEIYGAQRILVTVGVLMMIAGAYLREHIAGEVADAIRLKNIAPAQQVPFQQERTTHLTLLYGGMVAVGGALVALGVIVKWHPVPFTVLGMLLYVSVLFEYTLVHPTWLLHKLSLLGSLAVIGILFRALTAARAYTRERGRYLAAGAPLP
jgi:hypothetical protein